MGCQSDMKAKTAHSIACNIIKNSCVSNFIMRQGGDIVSARGKIVEMAIEQGATHVLFVDSDMQFPEDALERLLAHNLDIVGVEYNKRCLPLTPVQKPLDTPSDTLYKCEYVGTGLMLINLKVFKKIPQPWFNFGRKGTEVVIGEDVWFCNTARDAGFDVWCDPTLEVKHLGDYAY